MINTLFPGRPDYTGPTAGWFGLLHHDVLWEKSHDVRERVRYVERNKAENEVGVRLHNMIYLEEDETVAKLDPLWTDYRTKRNAIYDDYKAARNAIYGDVMAALVDYAAACARLNADSDAKRAPLDAEILAYIRTHIPDCAWNGTELVFP